MTYNSFGSKYQHTIRAAFKTGDKELFVLGANVRNISSIGLMKRESRGDTQLIKITIADDSKGRVLRAIDEFVLAEDRSLTIRFVELSGRIPLFQWKVTGFTDFDLTHGPFDFSKEEEVTFVFSLWVESVVGESLTEEQP